MAGDCEKINLIQINPEIPLFGIGQDAPSKDVKNGHFLKNKTEKICSKPVPVAESRIILAGRLPQPDEATEERQRTGRYLAIGVTLIMLFIAFYHTLLRHATVLAGLLAPAVIMLLYILWLFYFAKKKKTQVSAV